MQLKTTGQVIFFFKFCCRNKSKVPLKQERAGHESTRAHLSVPHKTKKFQPKRKSHANGTC